MARVKRGKRHLKRRKKLLRHAKGFRWGRKSKIKLAKIAVLRAYRYAWRDRRAKKRTMRQQWHIINNAFLRTRGLHWSTFLPALKKAEISLNRKILADMARAHPAVLERIIKEVRPSENQKRSTPG